MRSIFSNSVAFLALCSAVTAAPSGRKLKILKTTTTPHGQTIDWVVKESQGNIASPPPPLTNSGDGIDYMEKFLAALPEGPSGTVPMMRSTGISAPKGRPQVFEEPTKVDSLAARATTAATSYAGVHWYASTAQLINNNGAWGSFSMYQPFVQSTYDFSLIQTAVVYAGAQHAGTGTVTQTVETGWINYPGQSSAPHIFSYYTTNGYASEGNGVGGWNLDYSGFVQTNTKVYPGLAFTPLSVDGGAQYDLQLGYVLKGGNWWLWVGNQYIGYYPGSLFSQGGVNPTQTLANGSNEINFYGEVYNSETTMTTTDMGSGEFPSAGYNHSAYICNIQFYNSSNTMLNYNPNTGNIISDSTRYNAVTHWNSPSTWGSWFYLGGPGAGGKVGS